MRKYNGKQRKESFHARSLARSGFQRQRAAILPPSPTRYLVWIKSYLFVYVSLSAVCTPSRRCTTVQANVCMNVCAHVFHTYIRIPFPLYVSLSLSRAPPSLFPPFCCSVSLSLSLSLSLSPSLFRFCGDVVVLWAISSRMCIQSLHASGSVSQTLDAGPVS